MFANLRNRGQLKFHSVNFELNLAVAHNQSHVVCGKSLEQQASSIDMRSCLIASQNQKAM